MFFPCTGFLNHRFIETIRAIHVIPVFAVILLSRWIADKWPVLALDDLATFDDQKRLCVLAVVEHDVE